ncbi:MAG TPA: HEAT repeat domain-containing protein [Planctomycetota bacterium]|nr:HEAT repeat domain-containing protein [Planctomycetota bacterium]
MTTFIADCCFVRRTTRRGRGVVLSGVLAGLALLAGCGEKPGMAKTRPPVTVVNDGGDSKMLVDLRRNNGASVLRSIGGQHNLDDLDYTQERGKPTPIQLPTAAPAINAILLFAPGEIYDPAKPEMVEKLRQGFDSKKPVAVRLQAIQWAAFAHDARFIDNIAGEMKAGSLIADPAARALAAFADGSPADHAKARDALIAVLGNPDYILRAAAVRSLAAIGDNAAVPAIRAQFGEEKIEFNRVLLCHALGYMVLHGQPPIGASELARVQEALRKPETDIKEDPLVRAEAAVALVATGDKVALQFLKSLADTAVSPEMQYLGLEGLVLAGAEEAPIYVMAGLNSDQPEVWAGAIQLCAMLPPESIIPTLEHSLKEAATEAIAIRLVLALGYLQQDSALTWLPYAAENAGTSERMLALEELGGFGRLEYAEGCAKCLDDESPGVREAAARALFAMNATSYAARVAEAARYGNPYTRQVLTEVAARLAINAEAAANQPVTLGPDGKNGSNAGTTGNAGSRPPRVPPAAAGVHGSAPVQNLDQALTELQRQTLSKLRLVGWSLANGRPVAAVFRDGEGKERTALLGEYVYGGFQLASLDLEAAAASGTTGPPPAAGGPEPKKVVVALLDDGDVHATYRPNEAPQISNLARADTTVRP